MEEYFNPEYIDSRHRIIEEMRDLSENLPIPSVDWDGVYVFSGPEISLNEDPADKLSHKPEKSYNQTKQRLLTGFDVVREVTALRLKKKIEEVTSQDIEKSGPAIYFDGYKAHNELFRKLKSDNKFSQDFDFPDDKLIVSEGETLHTGQQITNIPSEIIPKGEGKIVFISDLYHIPRIKRYIGSKHDVKNIPKEKIVFYPSQPQHIPIRRAFREAKVIHKYKKSGDLKED